MSEVRTCRLCQQEKPLTEYNSNGYGGLRTNCKACQSIYRTTKHEWNARNLARARWQQLVEDSYPKYPEHGTRCWCCRMRSGSPAPVALCHVCAGT